MLANLLVELLITLRNHSA